MTCNAAGGTTGEIAAEFMEYSGTGTSISTVRDRSAFSNTARTCTTSSDTTPNLTPRNPDELVVTIFVSTTPSLTAAQQTTLAGAGAQGFTDNDWNGGYNGFFGATTPDSSYDSGWGEVVSETTGAGNAYVQWSGGGTSCYSGGSLFLPTISLTQGSYWFLQNADSLTPPGSLTGSQNQTLSLSIIGEPFRLRMLLDVNSPSGITLGTGQLDMILQFAPLPTSGQCADVVDGDIVNGGGWTPVATTGADVQTAIAWNQNPSLLDQSGTNITADTGFDPSDAPTYTTVLESYYQDDFSGTNDPNSAGDVTNDQNTLGDKQAGEWDFSLVDNTGGAGTGTYCLELANNDGSPLDVYHQYPEITFAKAGVLIRGGSIIKGSGGTGGTGTECVGSNHVSANCGTKIL